MSLRVLRGKCAKGLVADATAETRKIIESEKRKALDKPKLNLANIPNKSWFGKEETEETAWNPGPVSEGRRGHG